MTVGALVRAFRALPLEQQAEVKARLNEPPEGSEPSPERAKLLDERNAAADANPGAGYSLEEVSRM